MRNKLYWGLSFLIVLLIGVFVFVMVNQHAENQQFEADLAEAKKKLEAHNKAAHTPQVVDIPDVKPPDEPGFKWVQHGDHWDKVPIGTSKEKQVTRNKPNVLPSTYENPKRRKWLREGEEKPGHFHSVDEDGYLICDENGDLIQTPYGDPAFHIFTTIGFRPTYEEYQEYKKLSEEVNSAYTAGDKAEYDRLVVELLQFRKDHQGEVPDLTASTVFPDDHTPETPAALARYRRLVSERHNQLYREWGLGYLLED